MITKTTRNLLVASFLRGVGPTRLKRLANDPGFDSYDLDGVGRAAKALVPDLDLEELPDAVRKANVQCLSAIEHDTRILSLADEDYPALLKQTSDAPCFLYVKGTLPKQDQKTMAVIGTRNATQHGLITAQRIAHHFASQGWSIISGLALGCDTEAHRGALDAGGHTVAVLAHGLHTIAPSSNRRLAQAILDQGGALVSEYPFGQEPFAHQFIIRDRTQAGLARGVLLVQSTKQGGSLHASRASIRYGRWLAIAYPTEQDRLSAAPAIEANMLLAEGTEEEKKLILKCKDEDLSLLKVVQSREDYAWLEGR